MNFQCFCTLKWSSHFLFEMLVLRYLYSKSICPHIQHHTQHLFIEIIVIIIIKYISNFLVLIRRFISCSLHQQKFVVSEWWNIKMNVWKQKKQRTSKIWIRKTRDFFEYWFSYQKTFLNPCNLINNDET